MKIKAKMPAKKALTKELNVYRNIISSKKYSMAANIDNRSVNFLKH